MARRVATPKNRKGFHTDFNSSLFEAALGNQVSKLGREEMKRSQIPRLIDRLQKAGNKEIETIFREASKLMGTIESRPGNIYPFKEQTIGGVTSMTVKPSTPKDLFGNRPFFSKGAFQAALRKTGAVIWPRLSENYIRSKKMPSKAGPVNTTITHSARLFFERTGALKKFFQSTSGVQKLGGVVVTYTGTPWQKFRGTNDMMARLKEVIGLITVQMFTRIPESELSVIASGNYYVVDGPGSLGSKSSASPRVKLRGPPIPYRHRALLQPMMHYYMHVRIPNALSRTLFAGMNRRRGSSGYGTDVDRSGG